MIWAEHRPAARRHVLPALRMNPVKRVRSQPKQQPQQRIRQQPNYVSCREKCPRGSPQKNSRRTLVKLLKEKFGNTACDCDPSERKQIRRCDDSALVLFIRSMLD